ncbi:MAG: diguanylate cyclase [Bacilli bacterium]|nr:diguanylate cyclase [Bacilli bacterium]
MHSIRTKTTLLNTIAIGVAIVVTTVISAVYTAKTGHENAEQTLSLLCQTAKSNLEYSFQSVEQSTDTVSGLLDAHLDTLPDDSFDASFPKHVQEAKNVFARAVENTTGVLTYYYRFDPEITARTGEAGFWYTNLDGEGFVEHTVTDISDDQYECRWFYVPKNTGAPVWLPPYVTDNLDECVISYNVPVFRNDTFVGVVGIEISYQTLGKQIENIHYLKSGFAYIVESQKGTIVYHPYIDILGMPEEQRPLTPPEFVTGLKSDFHHIQYVYEGVHKHAHWERLSNDMSVVVAVPSSEVNETGMIIVSQLCIASLVVMAVFAVITVLSMRKLTRPLKDLTEAAERIDQGDYDIQLAYDKDDEIGVLTGTVSRLVDHLGGYIQDLNSLAYADALTSVRNKSAYDEDLAQIQARIECGQEGVEFAIAMFDCDDLKLINDTYGHDKGNIYLKNSSTLICLVFSHSDVYRVGGDEFIVILQGEDYHNREKLREDFLRKSADICSFAKQEWEQIHVSVGIASYDPTLDESAASVEVRADQLMYENKRARKKNKK